LILFQIYFNLIDKRAIMSIKAKIRLIVILFLFGIFSYSFTFTVNVALAASPPADVDHGLAIDEQQGGGGLVGR